MKKILLSTASLAVAAVASVSVAPTTSEAIPAFARQTGAACLNCHFQSFPSINAYGRSFKMNAFTDVGEQALVEDDHLSIPSALNMTLVFRPQFETVKSGGVKTNTIAATADQVVLVSGRVGAHTGAFVEIDTQGGGFANNQLINSYDMGDNKAGWSYFSSGFGEDAGMGLMNVWGQHGGLLGGKGLSINQAMAKTVGDTTGVSVWTGNESWMAQFGLVDPSVSRGASWGLAPMLRVVGFAEAGGFELGGGLILVSGTNGDSNTGKTDSKRTGIDFQAQGETGIGEVGIYADYATAPAGSATQANTYNASTTDSRTGYSLRATVKPNHAWVIMAGMGQDKTGAVKTDKTSFGAEYEVYQNFVIALTQSSTKTAGVKSDSTLLDIEILM